MWETLKEFALKFHGVKLLGCGPIAWNINGGIGKSHHPPKISMYGTEVKILGWSMGNLKFNRKETKAKPQSVFTCVV